MQLPFRSVACYHHAGKTADLRLLADCVQKNGINDKDNWLRDSSIALVIDDIIILSLTVYSTENMLTLNQPLSPPDLMPSAYIKEIFVDPEYQNEKFLFLALMVLSNVLDQLDYHYVLGHIESERNVLESFIQSGFSGFDSEMNGGQKADQKSLWIKGLGSYYQKRALTFICSENLKQHVDIDRSMASTLIAQIQNASDQNDQIIVFDEFVPFLNAKIIDALEEATAINPECVIQAKYPDLMNEDGCSERSQTLFLSGIFYDGDDLLAHIVQLERQFQVCILAKAIDFEINGVDLQAVIQRASNVIFIYDDLYLDN